MPFAEAMGYSSPQAPNPSNAPAVLTHALKTVRKS